MAATPTDEFIRAFVQSANTMESESDRGLLLVGLSWIDDALERLLSFYLRNAGADTDAQWLLDARPGNRPLASLAVRTRMAKCLGLMDDYTRNTIDELRSIRNVHAHGMAIFAITDEIADRVLSRGHPTIRQAFEGAASKTIGWLNGPRGKLVMPMMWAAMELDQTLAGLIKGDFCIEVKVPLQTKCKGDDPSVE